MTNKNITSRNSHNSFYQWEIDEWNEVAVHREEILPDITSGTLTKTSRNKTGDTFKAGAFYNAVSHFLDGPGPFVSDDEIIQFLREIQKIRDDNSTTTPVLMEINRIHEQLESDLKKCRNTLGPNVSMNPKMEKALDSAKKALFIIK